MSGLWDRTKVKHLVVHHLGNGKGPLSTKEELLAAANPHGYEYPEYEHGILADGSIIDMRPYTVIGAHTQADYAKYQLGENWWNRNAASIVIACDCSVVAPTQAQVEALIDFMLRWNRERGASFDFQYPHFQLSATACPGAKSSKLNKDTGFLDWDYVTLRVTSAAPAVLVNQPPARPSWAWVSPRVGTVTTAFQPLTVRSGAGLGYAPTGLKLARKTQWKVWGEQNGFYNVGGNQWVSKQYMRIS